MSTRLIDVRSVLARMATALDGTEQGEACKFALRLFDEQDELRKDKARVDWLADLNNTRGQLLLPRRCVLENPDSMRAAIDAAMEAGKA